MNPLQELMALKLMKVRPEFDSFKPGSSCLKDYLLEHKNASDQDLKSDLEMVADGKSRRLSMSIV